MVWRVLLAGLFCPLLGFAQEKDKPSGGASVYKTAVPSVVWVHSKRAGGLATGSGSLIDRERRLVLTNYHVVEDVPYATVYFPQFRDSQPIAEKDYYRERSKRLAIGAKVLAVDKKADLAILCLDEVPKDTPELKLAASSPDIGDNVHSIGSAGKSDALFGYVKGSVRTIYKKDWRAELAPRKIANFSAKVIETDSATNPGDSGGPLLNDKAELIGVTQGGAINAQLVSTFIDISEVKALLDTRTLRELKTDKPKEKKPPTVLSVTDGAKIFRDETVVKANEQLAALHAKNIDVLVLTLKTAELNDGKLEDLRSAKAEDRRVYFRDLTRAKMTATGEAEIGLVICADPKSFFVELTGPTKRSYPKEFQKQLETALSDGLKAGKPDDGLLAVLKLIAETKPEAKKTP